MTIHKIDFTNPSEKQLTINQILIIKRVVLQCGWLIKKLELDQRQYKRVYADLKGQPFQKVRADSLKQSIEAMEEHHEHLCNERRKHYKALTDWMLNFDYFESSQHEKAQLLGISHIYLDRLINDFDSNGETLFSLALLGAEDYFDKDVYVGARAARETPLKSAALFRMMGALKESPELREKSFKAMQETFGPIPMYRQSVNHKGETVMDRIPPKLTVVDNGGGHE